jgi:membrane dipeptidase
VKRIAGSGGVVGIIMHRPYLHRLPWKADVKRVLEEMMMVIDRVGVDCIAVGTDFDGMTWAPAGVNSYAFIELMRNELVRKGMGEDDLHKIFSGNYLRVMRQVCGGSS